MSYRCGEGLGCVLEEDNGGVCRDLPELGEVCEDGCSEGFCVDDTEGGARCTAGPGAGEACVNSSGCAEGLACEFSAMLCEPFVGLGGACLGFQSCAPEWDCVEGECVRGAIRVCELALY